MLTVYGTLMPLRVLEEIRFWKMQEKKHAEIIRSLIPGLEPVFVRLLQDWGTVFSHTEAASRQYMEAAIRLPIIPQHVQEQAEHLIRTAVRQSRHFIKQQADMLHQSAAIQGNPTARGLLMHTIRESRYFLDLFDADSPNQPAEQFVSPFFAVPGHAGISERAAEYAKRPGLPGDTDNAGPAVDSGRPAFTGNTERARLADGGSGLVSDAKSAKRANTESAKLTADAADAERSGFVNPPKKPGVFGDREQLTATGEGVWSFPAGPVPAPAPNSEHPDERPVPIGGHRLPPLPYPYDALEPHIDETTMRLHHDNHHKRYVDGLNRAEQKLKEARQAGDFAEINFWERELAFHGAGHYLHTIFWRVMSPFGGGRPSGALARQIERDFGGFDSFQSQFSAAAESVEGGGWALFVWSPRSRRTAILQAENHQHGSQWDVVPLLVLDVWEHAYYLNYRNERRKYIDAWWNVVDWPHVAHRFEQARKLKWQPF